MKIPDNWRKWVSYGKIWGPRYIVVDHSKSPEEMLRAGNYGHVEQDIMNILEKMLPSQRQAGRERKEVLFLKFGRIMRFGVRISTARILKRMKDKKKGDIIPAGIEDLLAIGEQFPELQLDAPMAALGAACECEFMEHTGFAIPCLFSCGDQRSFGLTRFAHKPDQHTWPLDYYFPAIGTVLPVEEPQITETDEREPE